MKKLLIVCATLFLLASCSELPVSPPDAVVSAVDNNAISPTALMAKADALDDKCRGGSGDKPETVQACDEREVVVNDLEKQGWCWGNASQYGYQKAWQKCDGSYEKEQISADLPQPAATPQPSASSGNCHWVNGYTRKSGVHVRGHQRCR